ncbi:hypothetical protein RFI_21937 [Reticulomyxa filosa]|uniref:Uncharacterized protein n=1 Tax=Reticulomyxa filosa TaxID=46433 RepID=X6MPU0_RETFI|nr:hypothetical protein RFI_21937 [Reticulomyxa filosa]|eukprot:ETO15427.1 hypothetical protein RFI_21937 [Reticulomyxa filosa]
MNDKKEKKKKKRNDKKEKKKEKNKKEKEKSINYLMWSYISKIFLFRRMPTFPMTQRACLSSFMMSHMKARRIVYHHPMAIER